MYFPRFAGETGCIAICQQENAVFRGKAVLPPLRWNGWYRSVNGKMQCSEEKLFSTTAGETGCIAICRQEHTVFRGKAVHSTQKNPPLLRGKTRGLYVVCKLQYTKRICHSNLAVAVVISHGAVFYLIRAVCML